jgi:hypothetical protein
MMAIGFAPFAEATIAEDGQFRTEVFAGERIVTPGAEAFAETCCTATAEDPAESVTVAVTVYVPTVL